MFILISTGDRSSFSGEEGGNTVNHGESEKASFVVVISLCLFCNYDPLFIPLRCGLGVFSVKNRIGF